MHGTRSLRTRRRRRLAAPGHRWRARATREPWNCREACQAGPGQCPLASRSLHQLQQRGQLAARTGRPNGALKSYRESLGIAEKLAKQDSGNADRHRDLSVSYYNVGNLQRAQGDLAGALKSYRESLGIAEKLAKHDPGNAVWDGDLAQIYWRTGSVWAEVEPKSKNQARAMVERGRDIFRQLKERMGLTAVHQEWLDSIEADLRKMQKKK